jgi:hypothetical protein
VPSSLIGRCFEIVSRGSFTRGLRSTEQLGSETGGTSAEPGFSVDWDIRLCELQQSRMGTVNDTDVNITRQAKR